MNTTEPRVETRTKVMVRAGLRDSGPERDVCILDASTRGILATAARPPKRGEFVELVVGRHTIIGQVKWASARRFGLALRERISIPALMAGDDAPLALAKTRAAQKRRGRSGAIAGGSRHRGRSAQYWALAAAAVVAGLFLSETIGEGLGSVQDARMAMASGQPDKPSEPAR